MLGELCASTRVGMFLDELGVLRPTVAFALSTAGQSCYCSLTVLGFATLLLTLLEFAASWQHYCRASPCFGPPGPVPANDKPQLAGASVLYAHTVFVLLTFRLAEDGRRLMLAFATLHAMLVFPASWQHYRGTSLGCGPPDNEGPFDKPRSLHLLMRSNLFVPHLTAVSWPPQDGLLFGHRMSLAEENFKTATTRATTRAMTPPTAVLVIAFWSYVVMPIRLGKFFVGGAGPIISWHELARPEHVRALWLERLTTRPGGSHLVAHPRTHVLFMHGSH